MLRFLPLVLTFAAATACTNPATTEAGNARNRPSNDAYKHAAEVIWELTRYETASWHVDVHYRRGNTPKALWMNQDGGGAFVQDQPSLEEAHAAAREKCEALRGGQPCFPVMENATLVLDPDNFR